MDEAQKLYDKFVYNNDPKSIIAVAHEIEKHFTSVWGEETKDKIGEEFLDIIRPKPKIKDPIIDMFGGRIITFEWLLLMVILDLNGLGYREYFPALFKKIDSINSERCGWARLVLKEIRSQMDDFYKEDCDTLIEKFDSVIESMSSLGKEVK